MYRTLIAALHFNENCGRKHAVTKKGEHRYSIVYPKYKKGGYVVKRIVEDPTYGKNIYFSYMYYVYMYAPSV